MSPAVSPSAPSRSGRRERGSPPITSFDANSGRSATATCMPPIIASTVSRAEKVAAYCTGEWYSLAPSAERSEEHTSELQSHVNLVCRLLLEKKKKRKQHTKD